ncbi:MAG: sulfatase-like hydrolase/transferase [Verrucomicrobia bacterium]|nr:sulfatase-like hydrolase/transferase [Verrucomicrobiota bacterium]
MNLLFLFTDEQRRDTLSYHGNDFVHMPNLNALADQACVFDNAHCTNPVCTPSRGSLMTGLYPHAHGAVGNNMPLNADARCLPDLLSPSAREETRIEYNGKWHLGDELYAQHGYERFVSIEDIYWPHFSERRNPSDRSDYHHWLRAKGFTLGNRDSFSREFEAQLPEEFCKPKFQADHACRFIEENKGRPWMLTVSMLEPHMPFFGCRDGQYDPETVPMFSNFDHVPGENPDEGPVPTHVLKSIQRWRDEGYEHHDLNTEAGWRKMTAKYLGLCSLIDTHMGRILDALRETGQEEDTLVVFTSDHGEMMGSHRLLAKKFLYRESSGIPLMIRLPGQKKGVRLNGPASQIDLVPTLLDLLGHAVPEHLHGRSLAPRMREAVTTGETEADLGGAQSDCVIVQHEFSRSLLSDDGWRYTLYTQSGEWELFDLNNDPGETRNLADDPKHLDRALELHEQIRQWQQRTGDTLELPAPKTWKTLT